MNTLKQNKQEHAEHTEGENSAPSVTSCKIQKPRKIVVPIAVGLRWRACCEEIFQEKMDGRYQEIEVTTSGFGARLAGELMPGGKFYAFDLLEYGVIDLRPEPLYQRLSMLDSILTPSFYLLNPNISRVPSATDGGAFLAEVLARGGEGVVRKRLDSPWGMPMEACKGLETFTCIVTAMNAGQSVQIALTEANQGNKDSASSASVTFCKKSCGSVKLGGGKCDRVRVGSILKIEGFGLTREGKIREPRPCVDSANSFLIQY